MKEDSLAGNTKIQWISHPELSAAHAAYLVATRVQCNDQKTEQSLIQPVTEVNNRLFASAVDVSQFWQQYLLQVLSDVPMEQACGVALLSAGANEMQVDQTTKAIVNRLGDARLAFNQRYPKLAEQLDLRARPLRERWETYGPGLMNQVGKQIWGNSPPEEWWMPKVTALMVQPIRGGDGGCDANASRLWLEAMLTDVDPGVPEVLRVAWLVTSMAIDQYARETSGELRLMRPWSLVSVPLVLSAARELELVRGDELPTSTAMKLWHFGDDDIAETVSQWWSVQASSTDPMPARLKRLDEMLPETSKRVDVEDAV
ncbi:MAG: hypothetical protein CMM01_02705 [Rhodopirellula sp.]|nr:hypothetical protein [Rhodopirellula sp.]